VTTDAKKVCWVTGASSGIGAAVALALVRQGHTVVISARGLDGLNQAAETLRREGAGVVDVVAVDVADAAQVRVAVDEIERRHGRIDVLVANAGLNVGARAWGEVKRDDFDRLVQVNLNGVYYCIDAVLPGMRLRRSGQVVNLASWAGKFFSAKPGPAYTSAKAAVVALTASLNMSEYVHNIRACAISPAEVATPAMARRKPPVPQEVLARMLKPEDVAAAVSFVIAMPEHACVNEIVLSPTWNAAFGAGIPAAAA
jgi:NADP-dependent 3-hydroxy acid dehydrogenase YdfG